MAKKTKVDKGLINISRSLPWGGQREIIDTLAEMGIKTSKAQVSDVLNGKISIEQNKYAVDIIACAKKIADRNIKKRESDKSKYQKLIAA